jgi:acetyl-CoA synthetase
MTTLPAWCPSEAEIQATNLSAVMRALNFSSYSAFHTWSVQHYAEFWDYMIRRLGIQLRKNYHNIVDLSEGIESPRWLPGAQLNIVESCFQAADEMTAIVWQAETLSTVTYGQLRALVNQVANGLVELGLQVGDEIAVILPMTIEAVAIYLGIIKAGCVVVSIADSFSAAEIATRFRITKPKVVFTQDTISWCGKSLPLYQKVIAADAPQVIVLGDLTWEKFLSSKVEFDAIVTPPDASINILFSSGTTGEPKAIPWTQTTPIKCATDAHLHQDIHPGDILAWSTNLGWMMGPWLIYASLINRATLAIYSGAPSDRGFGEFVQNAGVTMLGVVPSLVNTWKTTGCMQGLDWSTIKTFSSTGECSNPQDMLYLMELGGTKPIIEYCGGTEIGGAYITSTRLHPCVPATFTTPAIGLDFVILNEGEVFLSSPSIGLSTRLLNKDHHEVYFANTPYPELRRHGDHIERLPNGYYRALGRVDDTMNLNGIKVSAIEIEQVLNTVEGVCATVAIAVAPKSGGPCQLIIYAVLDSKITLSALHLALQTAIKQQLNPLFKIHEVIILEKLPRTASNKVMRRLLREQYQS